MNSYKKLDEKAQTANFSDLTRQRLELCAENARKTPKLEELKRKLLKILKRYDLNRGYHVKADVLTFPKMW